MTKDNKTDKTDKINKPSDKFKDFAAVFKYADNTIFGTKTFVTSQNDRKLSYGQTLKLTAQLCTWFNSQELTRGDRIIIISRDDLAVILLFMACLRYGLTAVILNPEGTDDELQMLIEAAKPKALFMDTAQWARDIIPSGDVKRLEIEQNAPLKKSGAIGRILGQKDGDSDKFPTLLHDITPAENIEDNPVPLDTVAYILFTSGTTSRPKGVEITHGNLLAQMQTFIRQYDYTQHSQLLNVLPLHHTDGLTQGPVVAFTAGACVHRPLRFSIDKLPALLDGLYKYKITHFIAVPSMLQLIDSMDKTINDSFKTETFRFVISTAGYLDPNLWQRFENRFDTMIVNVYGLTETVCEALYCGPDEATRKRGTIGKPVDTEIRIVGDDNQDVKDGKPGEIWLKGAHIMKGYFEMPDETAAVLTDDGWFKTGDLGMKDEDGFYHIVGRKKNLIIVGGINIYPDDVANVLRSMPGVLDAAVWGENDETWGEIVIAAVLPESGTQLDADALAEDFLNHASVEKLPRKIHIVKEFPRGPAGKVVLRDLQDMVAKESEIASPTHESSHDNIEARMIEIAAHSFKCPQDSLSLASTAETTKGWNSLAHVEFLLNLEKEYGIKMDPKDILRVRSLTDALEIVTNKTKKVA